MDISVVIPVYGCKAALPELHKRLTDTLQNISDHYEIILVNDACPQNSWQTVKDICRKDYHVVGIELSRNFGQMKAILAGLDYSSGDWVIVMDCDLQDRPEEIINLYHKALEGFDYVIAAREIRKDSWIKIFISKCFYSFYSYLTDVKYDPSLCNFSISKRAVIDQYCLMRESHRAFTMYLLWMGYHWTKLVVKHDNRFEGKSGYDFKKRIKLALDLLTSQSDKLLKLMTKSGSIVALISFLYILYTIIRHFTANIAVGYSSIIASIWMMGGLSMMAIGLVGIYVGNIFMEIKKRPLYIIRTILNDKTK